MNNFQQIHLCRQYYQWASTSQYSPFKLNTNQPPSNALPAQYQSLKLNSVARNCSQNSFIKQSSTNCEQQQAQHPENEESDAALYVAGYLAARGRFQINLTQISSLNITQKRDVSAISPNSLQGVADSQIELLFVVDGPSADASIDDLVSLQFIQQFFGCGQVIAQSSSSSLQASLPGSQKLMFRTRHVITRVLPFILRNQSVQALQAPALLVLFASWLMTYNIHMCEEGQDILRLVRLACRSSQNRQHRYARQVLGMLSGKHVFNVQRNNTETVSATGGVGSSGSASWQNMTGQEVSSKIDESKGINSTNGQQRQSVHNSAHGQTNRGIFTGSNKHRLSSVYLEEDVLRAVYGMLRSVGASKHVLSRQITPPLCAQMAAQLVRHADDQPIQPSTRVDTTALGTNQQHSMRSTDAVRQPKQAPSPVTPSHLTPLAQQNQPKAGRQMQNSVQVSPVQLASTSSPTSDYRNSAAREGGQAVGRSRELSAGSDGVNLTWPFVHGYLDGCGACDVMLQRVEGERGDGAGLFMLTCQIQVSQGGRVSAKEIECFLLREVQARTSDDVALVDLGNSMELEAATRGQGGDTTTHSGRQTAHWVPRARDVYPMHVLTKHRDIMLNHVLPLLQLRGSYPCALNQSIMDMVGALKCTPRAMCPWCVESVVLALTNQTCIPNPALRRIWRQSLAARAKHKRPATTNRQITKSEAKRSTPPTIQTKGGSSSNTPTSSALDTRHPLSTQPKKPLHMPRRNRPNQNTSTSTSNVDSTNTTSVAHSIVAKPKKSASTSTSPRAQFVTQFKSDMINPLLPQYFLPGCLTRRGKITRHHEQDNRSASVAPAGCESSSTDGFVLHSGVPYTRCQQYNVCSVRPYPPRGNGPRLPDVPSPHSGRYARGYLAGCVDSMMSTNVTVFVKETRGGLLSVHARYRVVLQGREAAIRRVAARLGAGTVSYKTTAPRQPRGSRVDDSSHESILEGHTEATVVDRVARDGRAKKVGSVHVAKRGGKVKVFGRLCGNQTRGQIVITKIADMYAVIRPWARALCRDVLVMWIPLMATDVALYLMYKNKRGKAQGEGKKSGLVGSEQGPGEQGKDGGSMGAGGQLAKIIRADLVTDAVDDVITQVGDEDVYQRGGQDSASQSTAEGSGCNEGNGAADRGARLVLVRDYEVAHEESSGQLGDAVPSGDAGQLDAHDAGVVVAACTRRIGVVFNSSYWVATELTARLAVCMALDMTPAQGVAVLCSWLDEMRNSVLKLPKHNEDNGTTSQRPTTNDEQNNAGMDVGRRKGAGTQIPTPNASVAAGDSLALVGSGNPLTGPGGMRSGSLPKPQQHTKGGSLGQGQGGASSSSASSPMASSSRQLAGQRRVDRGEGGSQNGEQVLSGRVVGGSTQGGVVESDVAGGQAVECGSEGLEELYESGAYQSLLQCQTLTALYEQRRWFERAYKRGYMEDSTIQYITRLSCPGGCVGCGNNKVSQGQGSLEGQDNLEGQARQQGQCCAGDLCDKDQQHEGRHGHTQPSTVENGAKVYDRKEHLETKQDRLVQGAWPPGHHSLSLTAAHTPRTPGQSSGLQYRLPRSYIHALFDCNAYTSLQVRTQALVESGYQCQPVLTVQKPLSWSVMMHSLCAQCNLSPPRLVQDGNVHEYRTEVVRWAPWASHVVGAFYENRPRGFEVASEAARKMLEVVDQYHNLTTTHPEAAWQLLHSSRDLISTTTPAVAFASRLQQNISTTQQDTHLAYVAACLDTSATIHLLHPIKAPNNQSNKPTHTNTHPAAPTYDQQTHKIHPTHPTPSNSPPNPARHTGNTDSDRSSPNLDATGDGTVAVTLRNTYPQIMSLILLLFQPHAGEQSGTECLVTHQRGDQCVLYITDTTSRATLVKLLQVCMHARVIGTQLAACVALVMLKRSRKGVHEDWAVVDQLQTHDEVEGQRVNSDLKGNTAPGNRSGVQDHTQRAHGDGVQAAQSLLRGLVARKGNDVQLTQNIATTCINQESGQTIALKLHVLLRDQQVHSIGDDSEVGSNRQDMFNIPDTWSTAHLAQPTTMHPHLVNTSYVAGIIDSVPRMFRVRVHYDSQRRHLVTRFTFLYFAQTSRDCTIVQLLHQWTESGRVFRLPKRNGVGFILRHDDVASWAHSGVLSGRRWGVCGEGARALAVLARFCQPVRGSTRDLRDMIAQLQGFQRQGLISLKISASVALALEQVGQQER